MLEAGKFVAREILSREKMTLKGMILVTGKILRRKSTLVDQKIVIGSILIQLLIINLSGVYAKQEYQIHILN